MATHRAQTTISLGASEICWVWIIWPPPARYPPLAEYRAIPRVRTTSFSTSSQTHMAGPVLARAASVIRLASILPAQLAFHRSNPDWRGRWQAGRSIVNMRGGIPPPFGWPEPSRALDSGSNGPRGLLGWSRIGAQVVRARARGRVLALAAVSGPAVGFVVAQTPGHSPPQASANFHLALSLGCQKANAWLPPVW